MVKRRFREVCEEDILPAAMAYGMTYSEFWKSNPKIVKAYAKAYAKRRELIDEQLWSLGQYFHIGTYVAIGRAFDNSGKFKLQYPDRPFSWPQRSAEEIEQEEYDRQLRKALAAEEAWIREEKRMSLPDSFKTEVDGNG